MKNMKKGVLMLGLMIMGFMANAQSKKEEKAQIKSSVVCVMCQRTIEYDLTFEKGVKSVSVDLDKKLIEIFYNPKKTNLETLRKRISMIGYDADSVKKDKIAYSKLPNCCQTDISHNEGMEDDEQ